MTRARRLTICSRTERSSQPSVLSYQFLATLSKFSSWAALKMSTRVRVAEDARLEGFRFN
ncbi:hypothetical protein SBA7_1580009 [Candidatus Sulfotelmatobacter sp. SbA7]|nr:hypothetical protein SBA7_1580009 [Candidatus Sulfotelmatobacter sp. SbA7]